jgi:hypothetical protein
MTVLAQFSQRADMAAERHRAAALDGRHHDQLVEADVPGIGYPPGQPRDHRQYLQPPTLGGGTAGARYADGGFPALLGRSARL